MKTPTVEDSLYAYRTIFDLSNNDLSDKSYLKALSSHVCYKLPFMYI
ncbi:hypothetical protein J32TS6_37200 [Virgibacillus pantothenticus]|nr:hypothetical protein J32TS6_37200 [Virgibacillus pantothenticus]